MVVGFVSVLCFLFFFIFLKLFFLNCFVCCWVFFSPFLLLFFFVCFFFCLFFFEIVVALNDVERAVA